MSGKASYREGGLKDKQKPARPLGWRGRRGEEGKGERALSRGDSMCKGFGVKRNCSFKELKEYQCGCIREGNIYHQLNGAAEAFSKNDLRTSPNPIGLSRTLWLSIK